MFYANNPFMPGLSTVSRFSFTSLLSNAGKALNVVNQAIPLVYQVKPLVNNAKTFFKVAKEFNNSDTNNSVPTMKNNINSNFYTSSNGPSFFI